ncbi:MAG: hypothetical protein E3J35_04940 [Methanomassiliicoccales archaeon]|nr:MAG: hypothetical protein E3J35_04940 [Methanomassiliicoccales archaeon]
MDAYTKWKVLQNEIESNRDSSEGDNPSGFSYQDGPFPLTNDDGSFLASISDNEPCWPYEDHCYFLDRMRRPPNKLGDFTINPHKTAGNFVVGDHHEFYIGDQNGNGILEWVVMFIYLPQMEDGIDNDGDGCVDEPGGNYWWPDGTCSNRLPDAAVVYETGGYPIAGGDRGDLLVNIDWYSSTPTLKLFRAFVSPSFHAYKVRGLLLNPQIAGEFISYYAHEKDNYVNSNPEMDNDLADHYVGNIDARFFPSRVPVNHVCSAGMMDEPFSTWKRDDGYVVTSYELDESYDDHDWNGDGDIIDRVVAYYAADPVSGNCRENVVNTGVSGIHPRIAGTVLTPAYTYESNDGRDWDQDGYKFERTRLYHDIDSTWNLKGRAYTSITFTAPVPTWGFGWWGLHNDCYQHPTFPLEFGGAFLVYDPFPYPPGRYYRVHFFLTSDEDGDRHSPLPDYRITYDGWPVGSIGGRCVLMYAREYQLRVDGNGDGDQVDSFSIIFCPSETGGDGSYIINPTGNYPKGMMSWPFLWEGYGWFGVYPEVAGFVTIPSASYGSCKCDYLGPPPQRFWCKTDQIYQLRWHY